ncbi:MAG: Clp protease N-terminal domain-containing protein [Emticicia sp.]|nr:Clp protease N-terminal domain-containing protein [Emticicia sp.]
MPQPNGQQAIETGHLLKAIIEEEPNTTQFLMKKLGVNQATFLNKLKIW